MRRVDDRRITVLRVIDRLNVGGPAIHAILTSRGLDPARFRTVLVFGSIEEGEADMSYLLAGSGIEHHVIPSLGRQIRPLRDLATTWKLFRLIRSVRPDVVHTHKAKAGTIGRIASLLARVPVRVHTFHGHVFHGYFSPAKTAAFLGIERALARVTTRIVALSGLLVSELSERYRIAPRTRFEIVPLGFDLAPFRDGAQHRGSLRARLGVDESARLVGIVGRMVPVKDHATFVDAMAIVARQHPEVRLVFVGGGELESEVRAHVARLGLQGRAHFLGWQRDLATLYADLDVVALSSINEGTPVTLIEAMASGIPVASTAVGGVADVLEQGRLGELSPPSDPPALAAAIERALRPAARDRARQIQPEVVERYGQGRLCRDLETLYERLLAGR